MDDNKWLTPNDDNPTDNCENVYLSSRFSMNYENIELLSDYLLKYFGYETLSYGSLSSYIYSIRFFPLDLNPKDVIKPFKLQIAGTKTNIEAIPIELKLLYTMGQWKCDLDSNNYLNTNGFTKIDVYLPYLGYVELLPNDCLNKYVVFLLHVDLTSGMGTYYICTSDTSVGTEEDNPNFYPLLDYGNYKYINRILSTYTFQLAHEIPVSGGTAVEIGKKLTSLVVKAGSSLIGTYVGYALGGFSSTAVTGTVKQDFISTSNKKPSLMVNTAKQVTNSSTASDFSKTAKTYSNINSFETLSSALALGVEPNNAGDRVNNSFSLSTASKEIHIVVKKPKQAPRDEQSFNHLFGKPLGEVRKLSNLTGYTEISEFHLEGEYFKEITDKEKSLLLDQLSSGIIL